MNSNPISSVDASTKAQRALGLDLVSMRVFVATADEGSLAKAAAREHIALSAVSRRISNLEYRAGVQLFDRHDRGMVLTAAGEALYGQFLDVVKLLERISRDMEEIRQGATGYVRIDANTSAASGDLAIRLAEFLDANPRIDLEFNEHMSLDVLHSVRTGAVDVGFVSGKLIDPQGLQTIPWRDDELVAILPTGHELAERSSLSLADLLPYPFIGLHKDGPLLTLYRGHARALGQTLRVRAHAASFENVLNMVSAGLGLSILPNRPMHPLPRHLHIETRPLSESWAQRELMLCVRDVRHVSAATKLLIAHLTQPGHPEQG